MLRSNFFLAQQPVYSSVSRKTAYQNQFFANGNTQESVLSLDRFTSFPGKLQKGKLHLLFTSNSFDAALKKPLLLKIEKKLATHRSSITNLQAKDFFSNR